MKKMVNIWWNSRHHELVVRFCVFAFWRAETHIIDLDLDLDLDLDSNRVHKTHWATLRRDKSVFTLYCNVCAWHAVNKGNLLNYLLLSVEGRYFCLSPFESLTPNLTRSFLTMPLHVCPSSPSSSPELLLVIALHCITEKDTVVDS